MENLIIIKTLDKLKELNDYLASLPEETIVTYDTETDGVDKGSRIIGFSICADLEVAYYVIVRFWDVTSQTLKDTDLLPAVPETLELLTGFPLVMQNAPFDCAMTANNFAVELMPSVHTDTLMLGHLLDENRSNGLKQRAIELWGESEAEEQKKMKESVAANGGSLTKNCYELYKADADLIAYYGAKDALLTLKIFFNDVPYLFDEGLEKFFYNDETMPLLRGPTYDLNTTGLRVDADALMRLKGTLEVEIQEARAIIYREIEPMVKAKYPGTNKKNGFNIGSGQQLSWLLFYELDEEFMELTKAGKELCKGLGMRMPYSYADRKNFLLTVTERKGTVWREEKWEYCPKKKGMKLSKAKKIEDPWKYLATSKTTMQHYAKKYLWVEKLLEFSKNSKLLKTYVLGIQSRMKYNIIHPSFLQAGTTSGRYSSRNPNFQNLPRDDKRVKSCIISRPGKVFIGADYSQLEPRVFAYFSGDGRLKACFANGDDFYSVIGTETFDKYDCTLKKDDAASFAKKYPELRNISKTIGLAATYGALAPQLSKSTGKDMNETQEILTNYFDRFPGVKDFQLDSHEKVKTEGKVYNLFGRPRRLPEALKINDLYGSTPHEQLPREARQLLNLGVNHRIQSTGASIMNRAAIAIYNACQELQSVDAAWAEVKLVMQIHDELVLEGPEHLAEEIALVLKDCMENTVVLEGVALIAEPKIANNLADLK